MISVAHSCLSGKFLRKQKLATGLLLLATACTTGGNGPGKSTAEVDPKLKLIDPPQRDTLVASDTTFVSPVDSSLLYPPDCYAKQAPVMCYDEAVQPSCYDVVEPETE